MAGFNKQMKPRIGITLSGGGARGAAHVGALQALNDNGIFPAYFSGASAGALVGALYCYGYTPIEILKLSQTKDFLRIFKIEFFNKKLSRMKHLRDFLRECLPEDSFESLKIPLHLSLTNLNKGITEFFSEGKLVEPILASCAVPFIFKPIVINETSYVDGGVLNNLPIEPIKNKVDKLIGISICPHQELKTIKGIRMLSERIFHLTVWNNVSYRLTQCDIPLEIEGSFNYSMFDVKSSEVLFEIGYNAMMDKIQSVKHQLPL
jgi:NTE family protein